MRGQSLDPPFDPNRRQNPAAVRDDACYLYDLEIGDSGAGWRRLRRRRIFSRLYDNVDEATLNPFTKSYAVVQDPPQTISYDDCRYKMFNVKFWGQSLIRLGDNGNTTYLPDRETNGPDRPTTQVPSPLKGYIQTDDGMYYTFDILGRRSFEIYATHVDAGILAPEASYDASALLADGSQDVAYDGIVDQSYIGIAISTVVVNSTQREDESTRNVRIEDGATVLIPVIPGSRSICVSPGALGAGAVLVDFTWNPTIIAWKGLSDISVSAEIVSATQTKRLCIPGAPFIRLMNTTAAPVQVAVTFSSEL
jgi:hypothetical protein